MRAVTVLTVLEKTLKFAMREGSVCISSKLVRRRLKGAVQAVEAYPGLARTVYIHRI